MFFQQVNLACAAPLGFAPASGSPVVVEPVGWFGDGDFNGDEKQDLAVAIDSNSVTILLGNGSGEFFLKLA